MNLSYFHRFIHFLYRCRIPVLPRVFYFIQFLIFNSAVPPSVQIGKGTKFAYGGIGVVIHKSAKIGKNCLIGQGITIGGRGKSRPGNAQIQDYVYIGAGARILGPLQIGSHVIIAPNAVVLEDIPSGSVVGGIPAKILKTGLSPDEINALI